MKRIIGLLFIVLSLSCCSKSETDKEEGGNYVLSIAPQNLKFPANDDSQNVIVASNGQWSLSGGDSWCTPSITSGGNGANVTFSVEKNMELQPRNTSFTFTLGNEKATLHVTQEAAPNSNISLNPGSATVSSNSNTQSVIVTCNGTWALSGETVSWCRPSKTTGQNNDVVTFNIDENNLSDDRNATYTFTCATESAKFVLTQKGKDALTVTKSKFEVSAQGEQIAVEVNANISFDYEIAQADKSWVSYVGSRAMTTSRLLFSISPNEETATREGTITITSEIGKETIKIYQFGASPALVLTQKEYIVPSDGQTIKVELNSNVDYEVAMPSVDWITESPTRAISTHTHYYTIASNTTCDNRSTEIHFYNKENNIDEIVEITQLQKDALIIGKTDYQVPQEGGTVDVTLQHNIDFEIKINETDTWITQIETRALQENQLRFNISENTTGAERIGKIMIANTQQNISQTITITQSAIPVLDIPDPNFKAYLVANYDQNSDNEISRFEIEKLKSLIVSSLGIASLEGIEHFTNLEGLACDNNSLTELDLSKNTQLTELTCGYNKISKLILPPNAEKMTWLSCGDNKLTGKLDCSNWVNLTNLNCHTNNFTALDLTGCSELIGLSCGNNNLTSLNVQDCSNLTTLQCDGNKLSSLDISMCPYMVTLTCGNNNLETLDLSNCHNLDRLFCQDNKLSSLDISMCSKLSLLYCQNNMLTLLTLGNASTLRDLDCSQNQLSSLIATSCTSLTQLTCDNNNIRILDISNCYNLGDLIWHNNPFEEINLGDVASITFHNYAAIYDPTKTTDYPYLSYALNNSTKLKITSSRYSRLNVSGNQLESLDISQSPNIQKLYCNNNNLTTLDVTKHRQLVELNCEANHMTELNLETNSLLQYLKCNYNQLTALKTTNNPELRTLEIKSNQIDVLDLSNNQYINTLRCQECPNLREIWFQNQTQHALIPTCALDLSITKPCYKENDGTYVLMNYYNEAGLEGIIYYLDADRKHGKILSLDEALLPWYKWNSSNNKASYPVSDWINTKKQSNTAWELPTIDDLTTLFYYRFEVNGSSIGNNGMPLKYASSAGGTYWSSEEVNNNGSYPRYIKCFKGYSATGQPIESSWEATHSVRAIASF
ncbi:BACON domain-containing protein [Alistipes sp.]|uniref:BACON domain-containing protein n=1 Tax=Alistipes sp. TaxID=1872444 RepID=UPI00132CB0CB|nr:BACON domain-containing carbohydrate-binding protein [Alistipes sp.]MUU02738.1 hypothetical protein [Alistipes sp.]